MRLLVIGLGSMGKRRVKLLLKYYPDFPVCGVDTNSERRTQTRGLFHINTFEDIHSAISSEKPDAALICTSPESHGTLILDCIKRGLHIFCEINLIQEQYEEILNQADLNNIKLFLSSTLLYRKEIEIIKYHVIKQKSKVNYRYHVGQYLPDWHPWENNRDFFVWNKSTNGCREIFAIDLPWIIKTFGKVKSLTVLKDNISSLGIKYPDNFIVVMEHENGNKGVFIADIVSRVAVRDLLVYSEGLHLVWNGTPSGLHQYNIEKKVMEKIATYSEIEKDPRYADSIIENAYLEELKVFIDKVTEGLNNERYTFEDDRYTLRLIDRIEGIEVEE